MVEVLSVIKSLEGTVQPILSERSALLLLVLVHVFSVVSKFHLAIGSKERRPHEVAHVEFAALHRSHVVFFCVVVSRHFPLHLARVAASDFRIDALNLLAIKSLLSFAHA